jgi:hypothetical protein
MILDDVVTELDVLMNDVRAGEDFGDSPIADKLRLAVETWLEPALLQHNYVPTRHRTQRAPARAWSVTGGTWADQTAALADPTSSLDLATALAAPATDALYLGLDRPFRGLFVAMTDTVNANPIAASITYWNGQWTTLGSSLTNGTSVDGTPFARAGRLHWPTPADWMVRPVNGTAPLYWVRVQANSAPSACLIHQLLPITRSRLTQPVALRALSLLYRESVGSRGDWKEKADTFGAAADAQLQLVIGLVGDEFDADEDGAVEATEVNSITREPWVWERG